ncbi:hypothetical protein HDU97_008141 [Phlyctochytrium planicorne]|nr:hypothetical protein HDU97_008141 [Phlyctochytrium planicorne]
MVELKFATKPSLTVWVNGQKIVESNPNPTESLISFVRRHGYTGTKLGCAEGGCGSCTVVVSSYDPKTSKVIVMIAFIDTIGLLLLLLSHTSVNACLAPVCSVDNKHVITIEGIGSVDNLHPVQERIARSHGSQCGFCTPGIVMALYATLQNNPSLSEHEVEHSFDGNLCRCTGYRSILDGAKTLARKKCNESCATNGECHSATSCEKADAMDIEDIVRNPPTAEFPKDLLALHKADPTPRAYVFEKQENKWFHPVTVEGLLSVMDEYPAARIINGNTEVGIETRFKNQKYPVLVYPADIEDLKKIEETGMQAAINVESNLSESGIVIGAAATISSIQTFLKAICKKLPAEKTLGFEAILENAHWFAGSQVRNVAAIAGNIVTASPISDLNPVFVALGAVLTVRSLKGGARKVKMEDFFLGYRKTDLKPSEIVESIFVPYTRKNEYVKAFKQAKRKDDDIAIVNAAIRVWLENTEGSVWKVKDASLSYGGMGPTTLKAKESSASLIGKVWSASLVDEISPAILRDLPLGATAPGGQIEFRKLLAVSFFLKFSLFVSSELSKINKEYVVDALEASAIHDIERPLSSGQQEFTETDPGNVVGRSYMHASALKQVTGAAVYIDDIPQQHLECATAIVGSTVAHGIIKKVDTTEALLLDGVLGYVNAEDVPHYKESHGDHNPNWIGPIFKDEELFATEKVHFMGQPIGLVVATTLEIATAAAKLVKVEYEKLPPIFAIEEAIEKESFFNTDRKIVTGVFLENEDKVAEVQKDLRFVEGVARMSGQEHFYLETNASVVVPKKEDDEIEVFSSTQNPTETQHMVAHVLGIPSNRVVVRVKRLGGGFGGKETRSVFISCMLAVAAKKFGKPMRLMLSREEDMALSGTRHPFLGKYRVGFTPEGKITTLELNLFSNGGFSVDLSPPVLERAITHSDNAYKIPHVKIYGKVCKTNLPTNTAFRGFGGPQGMMIAEQWMTHIAEELQMDGDKLRALNFYKEGDITHFSCPLEDYDMHKLWQYQHINESNRKQLLESSEYYKRREEVAAFNAKNRFRKRGIIVMPTKFGLAFTARFYNQAGALVHVYTDGSVLITHGGTEMGQGLHTKMIQIAAQAFNVPVEKVHLSETSTNTVPNTSATAASVSSDINGMAILDACTQIMKRLEPIREANPGATWEQIVSKAYFERVNLSANGFYKTPDLSYDWATNTGRMFSYFTYGGACTEVEIDTLTGDHVVLRSDVVMDIGTPINPAIDIGQIEGAFAQGQGWSTIEEPLISPTSGFLLTRGPGGYKIPGFRDIPADFRVSIMKGSRNARAVHSSKAVGEPPLFMGASVFYAIKDAIKAARADQNLTGFFRLDSPATSERIRLACVDKFAELVKTPLKPGEKPFSVAA